MDTPSETSILWTLIISSALARNGCLGNKISTIEPVDVPAGIGEDKVDMGDIFTKPD